MTTGNNQVDVVQAPAGTSSNQSGQRASAGTTMRDARLRVGPFSASDRAGLRNLAELPGPKGLPVVGSAFEIQSARAVEIFERWAAEYGALCAVKFPMGRLLLVTDAELGELILRARPHALRRWSGIELVFEELGARGVFSVEGDTWRAQRRLVMEALSQRHLRGFFPTLRRVTERLRGLWQRAADTSTTVEPTEDLMRFTTDVTVSLAFSTDMNSIEGGGDRLQSHLSKVFPAIGRRLNSVFPYWRYFRLPSDRQLDRSLAAIRALQFELLANARTRVAERQASGEVQPDDMLEAMLLARDEQGQPYSDEAIYGNMLTMLLAGEDTTAFALAWALHFLCERPDVVARMRREVDERLGEHVVPITLEMAKPLPYVDAVGQEVLRLKSPAPAAPLETLEEMILDDVYLPKATAVQVMTRLAQLDEGSFFEPLEFRPERWLADETQTGAHQPRVNVPFGSGPRICPGRSLALLEMRMVLVMLVRNFDIERVGPLSDVQERTAFVLTPVGIKVRLSRRVLG